MANVIFTPTPALEEYHAVGINLTEAGEYELTDKHAAQVTRDFPEAFAIVSADDGDGTKTKGKKKSADQHDSAPVDQKTNESGVAADVTDAAPQK